MSYIIRNKKYTNKRKCASLSKRTLYRLQSTAAKKKKTCVKQNKKQKKST